MNDSRVIFRIEPAGAFVILLAFVPMMFGGYAIEKYYLLVSREPEAGMGSGSRGRVRRRPEQKASGYG